VVRQLGEVLRNHPGQSEVRVKLQGTHTTEIMRLGAGYRVQPNPSLYGDLKVLLGPACLDA
jgi:DNA polymerase-3 subunit alpha